MADIAMCTGYKCKKKRRCYRHTAPVGMWQAWSPFYTESDCEYFIDNKEYERNNIRRDREDDK